MQSVGVLGAGTMGAQIAAHLANAGVQVLLLDVSVDAARQGLERARRLKPDPAFTTDTWALISTGAIDTDLPRLHESDWIIEAVVERIDVKRVLLEKVDAVRRLGSIVSSNTSGIPIAALAEGRSDDFRQHWLGTHFFNPPRYLHLLEVIPTLETRAEIVSAVAHFSDHRLGKGVVVAKDSPNFIGNHIGLYSMMRILAAVAQGEFTIDEVDVITGPSLGRPRSATFRTLDLAGLDIIADVIGNLRERIGDTESRNVWTLPPFMLRMLERGWTGEKAGKGFYTRTSGPDGRATILTLDPVTLEYAPQQPVTIPSIDAVGKSGSIRERVRALFEAPDRAGRLLRGTLAPTLVYTAKVTPSIAYSPDDVDRVMRWGFGWELGPFELIDAIGIPAVLEAAHEASPDLLLEGVPPLLDEPLRNGRVKVRGTELPAADFQILRTAKERTPVVRQNSSASLVDIGDGVLCVEFHSKMNVVGHETIEMLDEGVAEASRNFEALVIGNDAVNFSAGANLKLLLVEAQKQNWQGIESMITAFQQATLGLRYADIPVIAAPAGLTLGGGCEIALHADRMQAAAETYIGLVEVGVGLIPAAGGTKEMLVRAVDQTPSGSSDLLPQVQRAFETIALGRMSGSAAHARRLGYLRPVDSITMNRERLIADAKAHALRRVAEGYHPPPRRTAIAVGGDAVLAPLKLGIHLAWRAGRISDHDALIGRQLATVMAGGSLPHPSTVTEQDLLDLERSVFLSLIGEQKTQDRIEHTLKTGKPLRN
ncbi:MAG: 3-hydroxyacyl-CoA dehydrogenase [Acidobacteria bacterium]|nr:3-hydroxyacyl-CoA dehydrogenase [Acidobacteriota bacterium]